jgi:hypothetical protein
MPSEQIREIRVIAVEIRVRSCRLRGPPDRGTRVSDSMPVARRPSRAGRLRNSKAERGLETDGRGCSRIRPARGDGSGGGLRPLTRLW